MRSDEFFKKMLSDEHQALAPSVEAWAEYAAPVVVMIAAVGDDGTLSLEEVVSALQDVAGAIPTDLLSKAVFRVFDARMKAAAGLVHE